MLITRIFERIFSLMVWLILMSILGFFVASWQNPFIPLNIESWWRFVVSTLTGSYFYYHPMYTAPIVKLIITTLELVTIATVFNLLLSLLLVTFTIKLERVGKIIYQFFTVVRVIPFIALPLLFNQAFTDNNIASTLQALDDVNYGYFSSSRLWLIFTGEGFSGSRLTLVFNFLLIALTASYYILPHTYVVVARATNQILNYSYVKSVSKRWSSFYIMRKAVFHRLVPTVCRELPLVLSTFFFFVCSLEYIFNWRGIGSLFIALMQNRDKFAIEIGVIIFLVGSGLILMQFALTAFGNIYDLNQRKELPYEAD
ncbi:hypothetical protein [Psittacicella gerlachiana]|uniref:ABC transmembrane type-1 domain-containing protein n=1 Tax=Psittacicella gerlachiana TaxID=2028574 RepID=A0A3A1YAZ8_9GAMM|nr:hypothetical protein [Psittacicella gerlachiana]RIY35483.1 hypothetical protein CKF59_03555 [Psittacicella gerlachiana]